MKRKILILISVIILSLNIISPCIVHADDVAIAGGKDEFMSGFFALDSDSTKVLPDRFRIIPTLNISGSAQFVPSQVEALKKAINSKEIYIVDLRQETHGFFNDIAVRRYSPFKDLNNGFSSEDTLASEQNTFGSIKEDSVQNVYNKRYRLLKEVLVKESTIEMDLIIKDGLNYSLFATKDGSIPSPAVVDSFVEFVKITPESTHLHFHCDAGEGRTTMFMSMFQMMKESSVKSLNEILKEQFNAGGIILTTNLKRAEFLQDFYDYTKAESKGNFSTPFSKWAMENSKSKY